MHALCARWLEKCGGMRVTKCVDSVSCGTCFTVCGQ